MGPIWIPACAGMTPREATWRYREVLQVDTRTRCDCGVVTEGQFTDGGRRRNAQPTGADRVESPGKIHPLSLRSIPQLASIASGA